MMLLPCLCVQVVIEKLLKDSLCDQNSKETAQRDFRTSQAKEHKENKDKITKNQSCL